MSLKLPDFANELLDKIAQENGFSNFSMGIGNGSQPGDGFASEIYRIQITENKSSKKLDLVCKIAPSNENHRKEFFIDRLFRREALFYQHFMPMLAKFQEEKKLSKSDQFLSYPKCYGAIIDDEKQHHIIVLEDLRSLDFKLGDRTKSSSIESARITLHELGKFHGLSIAFKDQKPNAFNEFKQLKNLLPELSKSKNWIDMMENSNNKAINALQNADHKNVMRRIKSNLVQLMSHCFDEKLSECVGVFCHGDFWNNNLMFHSNEQGIIEDIRFLDWQMDHFGSPAIDIVYNLFTSTDKALRNKEYNNLIKLYYESLSKTVKLLGSDPQYLFTYENLLTELKRCGVYALLVAPFILEISQADSSEIPKLDEMFDKAAEGQSKMSLVAGLSCETQSNYDRRMNEVLEDVINLGYYQMLE